MIKIRLSFLFCFFFILFSRNIISACSNLNDQKFTLITTLYNEKNETRINEYITCLEYNVSHPDINILHIIYDTSKDSENEPENVLLNYLITKDFKITYLDKRPTYGICFNLANNLYNNQNIILANADIYFNATLHKLINYNLTNTFLALTRWNVQKDGTLAIYKHGKSINAISSQDAWIFKTPIRKFENDDIELGIRHCDGAIAHEAFKAKLRVINPCLSIQCCHLHASQVRNYDQQAKPMYPIRTVKWSKLTS